MFQKNKDVNNEKYQDFVKTNPVIEVSTIITMSCAYVIMLSVLISLMLPLIIIGMIIFSICFVIFTIILCLFLERKIKNALHSIKMIEIEITTINNTYEYLGVHKIKQIEEISKCTLNEYLQKPNLISSKEIGMVYEIFTMDNIIFRIWLPNKFKECFKVQKQLIYEKRFILQANVMHGWFQEVLLNGNLMICFLKASDNYFGLNKYKL